MREPLGHNSSVTEVLPAMQSVTPSTPFPPGTASAALLARLAIRRGEHRGPTAGLAPGHVQANLAIVPAEVAPAFERFCRANPVPCPLLAVSKPGDHCFTELGTDLDLRTDFPRYRIYRHGLLAEEPEDLLSVWRDDLVAFAIGCSFSFEEALLAAGLPVRHIERGCNVPMYVTDRDCVAVPPFAGRMVVSMRPMTPAQAERAAAVTGRYAAVHGAPVHIGDPEALGIRDLSQPEFGDAVPLAPGEVPVFWACGVTPQVALAAARLPFAIAHSPGHMLVTDRLNAELEGVSPSVAQLFRQEQGAS